jgi:hypothetical protein
MTIDNGGRSLLHVDPTNLATTKSSSLVDTAWLTSLLRINNFVGFHNVFLRMNHQIDAVEWPSFCQRRLLRFRRGIPFSTLLTPPSLPQPRRGGALSNPLPRIDNFVGFQLIVMRD